MAELRLDAQPRTLTGRKVRQLRTQGLVPAVVYGNQQEPVNLQVNARSLELLLRHGGFSQLVEVHVEGGGMHNVLVREIQRHPVNHSFRHVDLYAVNMSEKQRSSVPIFSTGHPTAMVGGLMLLQAQDTVEIEALPANIPASIEVDITTLDLDRPITIADLPELAGVAYMGDASEYLFTLATPRVAEELEALDELDALAAADGELAEPEVVGEEADEAEGDSEEE